MMHVFTSMQTLRAMLEADMKIALENIDQIKAAHLSQSEFYAELEKSKESVWNWWQQLRCANRL